ncbi:low temperature requirement protein A [Cellulomonas composti]|uniref:Low temperature requirement protein A n=1 Tax=Cellulomonas composti TaxID=266130 RepID=A0A511J6R3_9CELL|nr:low temperature requirement protein A [Cellulomonas composti]GEL93702.1 hypothetical protein CCO02nite_03600 [Cellulomonas composti]
MTDDTREDSREDDAAEERHASWLELFFDLVVVAGIGALAHLLHEDSTAGGVGLYAVAFTAFWLVWACFTTYGNLRAARTQVATMLVGMAALAVMTASVFAIDEHGGAFAVAYVVGRFVASRPWNRGTVVVDLPVVQAGIGIVPWVVSWWFVGTAQHVLWAVGLGLDLMLVLSSSRGRMVADMQRRLERVRAGRDGRRSRRGRGRIADRDIPATLDVAEADLPHLAERMSLFMLIVLGESLIQAIDGAADAVWGRPLAVTAAGVFVLVVGLWAASVQRGSAGVALLAPGLLAPRLAWVAHLVTTGAVATLAAVVATFTAAPQSVVSAHDRTLVVVALAVYGAAGVAVHLGVALTRPPARSAVRRASLVRAACVGLPITLAVGAALLHRDGTAERFVWELAGGVVLVLVADGLASGRLGRRSPGRPGHQGAVDSSSS